MKKLFKKQASIARTDLVVPFKKYQKELTSTPQRSHLQLRFSKEAAAAGPIPIFFLCI